MSRLWRVIAVVIVLSLLGLLVCAGTIFVLSGGRLGEFIQDGLARIRLASRQVDLESPHGLDDRPVRFVINPGETPRSIAERLLTADLISDPDLFIDFVRAYDIDVQLEAGTFFLYRTQSLVEIANALTDSASSQFTFTLLPGERIEELAFNRIDGSPFFGFTGADFYAVVGPGSAQDPAFAQMVGLPAGASLEGFLFPDTYQLPAAVTPLQMRDIMTAQFMNRVDENLRAEAQRQGLTLYQAVTLASIIQREAIRIDEMPLISSVYRNRLRIGMKLDADPTVQYGLAPRGGSWWPPITIADYQNTNSPYNTYRINGLPPGPIAAPSLAAIRAAISPENSPYYYFRARCDGSGYHNFAVTFEEHLGNACP